MLSFSPDYFFSILPGLTAALPFTFYIIVVSAIVAILSGALVSVVRISRVPLLFQISEIWLSFVRSMPFVLLLFLIYFVFPVILGILGINKSSINKPVYIFVTMIFAYAPVIAEVIRPAYFSIDKGQREAAAVFGLTPWQQVTHVIIPQMIPVILPPMINQIIEIVKDTSLIYMIGLMDIMGRANLLVTMQHGRGKFESYVACAVLYWVIVGLMELIANAVNKWSEKKLTGGAA